MHPWHLLSKGVLILHFYRILTFIYLRLPFYYYLCLIIFFDISIFHRNYIINNIINIFTSLNSLFQNIVSIEIFFSADAISPYKISQNYQFKCNAITLHIHDFFGEYASPKMQALIIGQKLLYVILIIQDLMFSKRIILLIWILFQALNKYHLTFILGPYSCKHRWQYLQQAISKQSNLMFYLLSYNFFNIQMITYENIVVLLYLLIQRQAFKYHICSIFELL